MLFGTLFRPAMIASVLVCCSLLGAEAKEEFVPAALPRNNLPAGSEDHAARLIDAYFLGYWSAQGITLPKRIDEATFLRRASLGLNGVPPTVEDMFAFLESEEDDKGMSAVNELLTCSRYADYWGFRLRHWILELRESVGQGTDMRSLYRYMRQATAENLSWDTMARDLLATQGAIRLDGRASVGVYFDGEANEYAEAGMRLFLGTNVVVRWHRLEDRFSDRSRSG